MLKLMEHSWYGSNHIIIVPTSNETFFWLAFKTSRMTFEFQKIETWVNSWKKKGFE
jgi:hypothetical protein